MALITFCRSARCQHQGTSWHQSTPIHPSFQSALHQQSAKSIIYTLGSTSSRRPRIRETWLYIKSEAQGRSNPTLHKVGGLGSEQPHSTSSLRFRFKLTQLYIQTKDVESIPSDHASKSRLCLGSTSIRLYIKCSTLRLVSNLFMRYVCSFIQKISL